MGGEDVRFYSCQRPQPVSGSFSSCQVRTSCPLSSFWFIHVFLVYFVYVHRFRAPCPLLCVPSFILRVWLRNVYVQQLHSLLDHTHYQGRLDGYVLNGTPNGRYALPAKAGGPYRPWCTPAWPVQPKICEEDRNGAGTQEVQLGFGPGRYDNQFLIPSAIPIHAEIGNTKLLAPFTLERPISKAQNLRYKLRYIYFLTRWA